MVSILTRSRTQAIAYVADSVSPDFPLGDVLELRIQEREIDADGPT